MTTPKRIAVIGSGIAGLSAAWLLSRGHRVTLFEAGHYLGGHTNTVNVTIDSVTAPVDTGFLVFNDRTYPNLIAMFDHLGVRSTASDMSFSVRIADAGIEWAGADLAAVFAQPRNLFRPAFIGMLRDIVRFNREATAALARPGSLTGSLGEFLERGRYGQAFRDWYLLPMSGAIWSCPTATMLDYPAATFMRFCHNHGLLQIADRPQWRTVVGGGRDYVRRMAAGISDVRRNCPVRRVARLEHGVAVTDYRGQSWHFDEVVMACHSDQALALLADPVSDERRILGAVKYQPNRAVLHTDAALLPRARRAWSAWNYHSDSADPSAPVGVSYLINKLQPLPWSQPVIVTLNPEREPAAQSVIQQFEYAHPVFDGPAVAAQRALHQIQGKNHTWYCGAWTGYGFHEDGLKSGIAVAAALGCGVPWQSSSPQSKVLTAAA